jgi:hypothetical protein
MWRQESTALAAAHAEPATGHADTMAAERISARFSVEREQGCRTASLLVSGHAVQR